MLYLLQLYRRFVVVIMKGLMEYRLNFFLDFFALFVNNIAAYFTIWLVMSRFEVINGWSYYEVMVLVGLYNISWGACGLFIRSPLLTVEYLIRDGKFDNILTKPIPTLLHVIMMKFNHIWFSNIITGLVVLLVSLHQLGVSFGVAEILWLAVTIVSGVMILSGLIIAIGTLSFRFIKAGGIGERIFHTFSEFIQYPITIYPKFVQFLLTIVPFAFVNFYPAHLFLERGTDIGLAAQLRFGAPLVGVVLLVAAIALWNASIRHYQSTGS